ncbi:MAG: hypothetical protein RLZZ66_114 [Pseudomonadota bacterium]|jgi:molybdate transport system substrate-binding protein
MRLMILFFFVFFTALAKAETTLVAVASNFTKPMTEIAAEFEKSTGHSAKLSFGSSGKFVSQIENGAPFDVFLSADDKSPANLQQGGFAVEKTDFTYALGKLVLWSATANYVDDKGDILNQGGFQHLSLADPKLAPYGAAAVDVLKNQNVLDKLQPLVVVGENISQAYQFISTGNAELGFIALSQVSENGKISSGSAWIVPQTLYAPIKQNAVLLKTGENNPAAKALLDYLKTAPAKAIIQKYGYDLPH